MHHHRSTHPALQEQLRACFPHLRRLGIPISRPQGCVRILKTQTSVTSWVLRVIGCEKRLLFRHPAVAWVIEADICISACQGGSGRRRQTAASEPSRRSAGGRRGRRTRGPGGRASDCDGQLFTADTLAHDFTSSSRPLPSRRRTLQQKSESMADGKGAQRWWLQE